MSTPTYTLSGKDIDCLDRLTGVLAGESESIDDGDFLARIALCASQLPAELRSFAEGFRAGELLPACVIRGYPVDDERIGPSPTMSNRLRAKASDEYRLELAALLLSSLLGDVFGWRLQHDGSIIHDLAPRLEHEDSGLGTGSRQHIDWHTEDSFHPCRADYVGLFCVRNPAKVATTIGFLARPLPSPQDQLLLSAPVFTFLPDPSYLFPGADPVPGPDQGSVLFGDPAKPYLRFDQEYIDWPRDIEGLGAAVEALRQTIDADLSHLALEPGDFLLLDNRRAVHGRAPFEPSYNGSDRWLKRVNITLDLQRSRHLRRSATDRVIHV